MNAKLLLLLAIFPLSACNVVVTTPAQPELSVAVETLPGRWYNVEQDGTLSADEYLDVFSVGEQNHYNVVIYDKGQEDGVYQVSLCPSGMAGGYWGFVRVEDYTAGFLLFHLKFTEERTIFRWLDEQKTKTLLDSVGLPFEFDIDSRIVKFSTLKIHATWSDLLKALNTSTKDVLGTDTTRFQRTSS